MGNMTLFIAGIAILSLGTYLMRLGGAKLGNRLAFSERSQALLSDAATVLLFSVALATTFYEGAHFGAGMARVLGVAFAVFLAWRKVPLIGVIIAAAVVTALLRLAGIN
ncbi:AzlD domain-containing protein [Klebsiella pneumoniae]